MSKSAYITVYIQCWMFTNAAFIFSLLTAVLLVIFSFN